MNSLNFTGGIPRDAEVRFTSKGEPIVAFSVSLTSGYGDNKNVNWMNCTGFGKRYESLAPYLVKGAQVAITGEFNLRKYNDKAGAEKVSPDVNVREITLIGGKPSGESVSVPAKTSKTNEQDDLESIPF